MVIHRLRLFHALLAILVVLAYVTGDDDTAHYLLGYGVALLVLLRLAWALTGVPQLGLMKFYPHFEGLRLNNAMTHPAISRTFLLAIAVSILLTVGTGIAMDRGHAFRFGASGDPSSQVLVSGEERRGGERERRRDGREHPEWLEEVHEVAGNLVLVSVALHVTYLLIWKRPLALFMLFLRAAGPARRRPPEDPAAP